MKIFPVIGFILLAACSALDINLQNALAFGNTRELNELSPEVEKQLLIKIYESPVYKEGCFRGTHGICQYRYYLSVSTFDEYPETNIYELKTKGEIIKVTWKNEEKIDTATLSLVFNKFTSAAIKNNNSLKNQQSIVHIEVDPSNIFESSEAGLIP